MDQVNECLYCSTDLLKGINWWFDYNICNDCHNREKDTNPEYALIIRTEIMRKIIFGED